MSNKICFNTNIIILVILLFGFLLYLYQQNTNKNIEYKIINTCKKEPIRNHHIQHHHIQQQDIRDTIRPSLSSDPVKRKDNLDMRNPLVFPEERLDRHNLYLRDKMVDNRLAYVHTQGFPDTPKLRGYLYENTDKPNRRILPLFGYETYPNSYRFKYYTILNDVGLSIHLAPKIEIEYRVANNSLQKLNKNELYNNDVVQLNNLETSQFTIKMLDKEDDIKIY